jgi:hypothetical protein
MSIGTFKNSIKNLVEKYIPEEFEGVSAYIVRPGSEAWCFLGSAFFMQDLASGQKVEVHQVSSPDRDTTGTAR